ncbi:MAG: CSLREA domain-containing protein [Ardenticatenaceae bacterium]|nr:CSLREA domain-containing protein [Ardenticatenaceae bacterium]
MNKQKGLALTLALCQTLLILPLLFWLFQQTPTAYAASLNVNTFTDATDGNCNDGTCSLRDAIALAAPFDTIYLPAGSYVLSSGLGQLNVSKTITLIGQGANATSTVIDGNNALRLFNISSGTVTFNNLTLQNGQPASGNGGAILTSGSASITLDNAIVRNSETAGNGGGIFLAGGTLAILNGSEVSGNTAASSGGGVYSNNGTVNLTDSTVSDNIAQLGGGLTLNLSPAQLTINNGQILRNVALMTDSFTGGGINIASGSAIMNSGLISGNTAFRGGGALILSGSFTMNGGTVTDNESNYGGGFYVRNPSGLLTLNDGAITGNRSVATIFGGGALYVFQGQAVQNGGEISNNTAVYLGGAMEVRQGGFTMNGGSISGNSSGNWGGAIYNDIGTITITNGTLTNNYSALGGGAIATGADSQNLVRNSVIYSNSVASTENGGAILNTGTLTLTNVTLSDNFANSGGGLHNQGSATLTNVTVYENTAVTNGGGLHGNGGTLNVVNSIIAGNSAPTSPDCAGTIVSGGYNLIQSSSGCTVSGSSTGNLSGNPQLAALALNGGSTLNHALGSGSPALDAGNNGNCAANDQRGVTRPVDGNGDATATCDMGAFEYGIQLEIGDATVTEGDSGTVTASFIVTRSLQTSGTDTVEYATVADSADGSDFTAVANTTLTFNPGDVNKTINIDVTGDTIDENDETFFVQLSNPSAGVFFSQSSGTGTILNDDGAPRLSIADVTISEGSGGSKLATFTVSLSAPSASTVQVNYATANDTAVAPADYTSASNTLTFTPGDTEEIISITINSDTMDENDETFLVTLNTPVNAIITDGQATGTITDDDAAPSLSIAGTNVSEGDSGTTTATFAVTLSAASGKTVTVNYATMDDTAVSPTDYTITSGALTFNPGETQKNINVTVNGDATDEDNEAFLVTLNGQNNAGIGQGSATGTINDDDDPPTLSIADIVLNEGNSGSTDATFTVMLDEASSKTITVDYATAAGTAVANTDFTTSSDTLTINPGSTSQAFTISVIGDTLDEDDELFYVNLSNASSSVNLTDTQAQATITDDDAPPTLAIGDVTISEGDSGTKTAVFTVALSQASSKVITVDVTSTDGTAAAGEDYTAVATTLTFNPGDPLSQTVSVTIHGDTTNESNETFQLTLSGVSNATLGNSQATGTITNDDGYTIYLPFVVKP